MYNLFVSADEESWQKGYHEYDISRFLEYTDKSLIEKYNSLNHDNIKKLCSLPGLFAYEDYCEKEARLGQILEIKQRGRLIRIKYKLQKSPLIKPDDITKFAWELGIVSWEMNRSHWAIKEEDLYNALKKAGYKSIQKAKEKLTPVDIRSHKFDIALTFPGEVRRQYVKKIADQLTNTLGKDKVFYDFYYKAQLARPNLNILLQEIYKDRANLIVVFLCEPYGQKEWCGLELRVINEIIKKKEHSKIMLIKLDEVDIEGILSIDGFIDGRKHTIREITEMIIERSELENL